jgi:uncharacterized membrane protein YcfT
MLSAFVKAMRKQAFNRIPYPLFVVGILTLPNVASRVVPATIWLPNIVPLTQIQHNIEYRDFTLY